MTIDLPETQGGEAAQPRDAATASTGSARRAGPHGSHLVQFYDDDEMLYASVTRFVGAGLAGGEGVIVAATAAHMRGVEERLARGAFDVARAVASGRLLLLDADATLADLMVGSTPDPGSFERVIGDAVARARGASGGEVRVYGEMVDVLSRAGNVEAALALERRWESFLEHHSISLLCGYVSAGLETDDMRRLAEAHEVAIENARAVTSLRRAERAAEAERQRLHDLFMVMPASIWILRGPDHVIEFVNRVASAMFPDRELVGRPIRAALPEVDPAWIALLDRVLATAEPYRAQAVGITLDWGAGGPSSERFFDIAYEPFRDEHGAVVGVTTFSFDVTEQVVGRRKMQAIVEELETANRTKDDFLATLSHELRTPLNAILGWVRMLRGPDLASDKHERALETIERNAFAQAQLVDDLLDVSRIVEGKLRLDVATVDLGQVVGSAAQALAPAASAKGVEVVQAIDAVTGMVGDKGRLQQIVWNLLSNAIKFTPRGGRVEIVGRRVGADTEDGGCVEIVVSDTGQGIDAAFLPHVFQRFSQADSTLARKHMGLGLGLAIVRHLVELHGGRVSVESRGLDQGARFTVVLPISPVRGAALDRMPALRTAAAANRFAPPPELAGVHALIVEDEEDARELMVHVLAPCKMRISTAANVAEALEVIENDLPAVIVSDIGMPGEDGYAFVKKLRALPEDRGGRVPAVALTAYTRVEDKTRALVSGFNMHVPKPVEPAELVAVLASLASLFQSR